MENAYELFHTGFQIIEKPDITIGRTNADFGQGFYLSPSKEFAGRWAKKRKNETTYMNRYILELSGLSVKRFCKDTEWFDYICRNRGGYADGLKSYDVIIGPIANDTIYDSFGIMTSGIFSKEDALGLLLDGPSYEQVVLKTEKAVSALTFVDATPLNADDMDRERETVKAEEADFQKKIASFLEKI